MSLLAAHVFLPMGAGTPGCLSRPSTSRPSTRTWRSGTTTCGAPTFDVANHPKMTFLSKEVRVQGGGRLHIIGDLTVRGTTRSVTLDADPISEESKNPFGMIKVGTSASASVSRKDFGLVWNAVLETGGVAVGDDVEITLDLQFQRKA